MQRVSCLFHGNPGLIQGFNTFLPVGYRIDISDTITFTTPSSTTTQRINQNSNSEGGFFAGASQFRATQCEMNENHGHQVRKIVLTTSIQFINCRQFNNHYHNSGSKPAALMWAQLLIMTPPSAFIAIGHGGHLYLNKLHQYLNSEFGDSNIKAPQLEAKHKNSLTLFMSRIRDISGFVNILFHDIPQSFRERLISLVYPVRPRTFINCTTPIHFSRYHYLDIVIHCIPTVYYVPARNRVITAYSHVNIVFVVSSLVRALWDGQALLRLQ